MNRMTFCLMCHKRGLEPNATEERLAERWQPEHEDEPDWRYYDFLCEELMEYEP